MDSGSLPFVGQPQGTNFPNPTKISTTPVPRSNTIHTQQLPSSQRFLLPSKKDYQQQYFNVYRSRLEHYREFFTQQIQSILDEENNNDDDPIEGGIPIWTNLPDAKPMQECVIIGISYKNMDKKPSVLDDVGYRHQKADDSKWNLQVERKLSRMSTPTQSKTKSQMVMGVDDDDIALEAENIQANSSLQHTNTNTIAQDGEEMTQDISITNDRNYCQDSDVLHLEDINGRVPLIFTPQSKLYTHHSSTTLDRDHNSHLYESKAFSYLYRQITQHDFVSGMILAAQGQLCEQTGEFQVNRIFTPSLHFEPISPTPPPTTTSRMNDGNVDDQPDDTYIALMSGINLAMLQGPITDNNRLQRIYIDLLLDFLTGPISTNEFETTNLLNRITHAVIAGDLVGSTPIDALPPSNTGKKPVVAFSKEKQLTQMSSLHLADLFLTRICSTMHVYLLPGTHDPTNYTLPQQPFHPSLLPSTSTFQTFHGVTNPADFTIKDIHFTGTDGLPVTNITKYSKHNVLSSLSLLVQSQHLAPTGPDTIPLYPFQDKDPLLFCTEAKKDIKKFKQPNVAFAGNTPCFQSATVKISTMAANTPKMVKKMAQNVELVCIPNFSSTASIVLMNSRTKRCVPVYFGEDQSALDNVEMMLSRLNLTAGQDEDRANIDFADDDEAGGEGGDGGE